MEWPNMGLVCLLKGSPTKSMASLSTFTTPFHSIRTRIIPCLSVAYKPKPTLLRFSAAVEEAIDQTALGSSLMHFQAEGTMNETAIPNVTKALEEVGGISDVRVQVFEGIASVELTKETTTQATGVASGLLEAIQGSGFKLQTLNLSFVDEEELVA